MRRVGRGAEAWVLDGVRRGDRVGDHVPAGYARYAKLLHPIREDLSVEDREATWHDVEGAPTSPDEDPVLHRLEQGSTLVSSTPDGDFPSRRVLWRDLAGRYDVPFGGPISSGSFTRRFGGSWPRYLVAPSEGDLGFDQLAALLPVLVCHTESPTAAFYYVDLLKTNGFVDDWLFEGPLEDMVPWLDGSIEVVESPTYWWPADRAWCVWSDHDSAFSIVAGSAELLEDLHDAPDLELVDVVQEGRLWER